MNLTSAQWDELARIRARQAMREFRRAKNEESGRIGDPQIRVDRSPTAINDCNTLLEYISVLRDALASANGSLRAIETGADPGRDPWHRGMLGHPDNEMGM